MSASNKRMLDRFPDNLTVDQSYELIFEELPQASKEFIVEMDLKNELIGYLCSKRGFPCTDKQALEQAVLRVESYVEGAEMGVEKQKRMASVAALMELGEVDMKLELRGKEGSSVYSKKHEKAGQTPKRFELKPIPLTEDEKASITSVFMSLLMQKQERKKDSFYYFNESDIQHLVHAILQDAIQTSNTLFAKLGSPIELQYRLEANIWSEKPDHAVVFDKRSGAPLVSIEVKKPIDSKNKRSLDEFDRVRGQGCDYLYVSKLQGHSCPIHITTTIVESYVAWLPDNVFVQEYNNASEGGMEDFWQQLLNRVHGDAGTNTLTQSPLRLEQALPRAVAAAAAAAPTQSTPLRVTDIDRTICTSQCFKRHQLFQVMVNAILCGLHGSSRSPSVPRLYPGDRVTRTALELTAKGYKWVELDAVVQGPLPERRRRRLDNFLIARFGFSQTMYAVGLVGFGNTSKAFRVVTSQGYEGVAKVYVKKNDDDGKSELDKKIFDANAKESVSRELEVFQNTYPDMPVSQVVVHGHKGLLMPFFSPIRTDHEEYENRIKEQLSLISNGRSRLCYKKEDMRWRHVGLYGDGGEVRVFDFNDMNTIQNYEVASQVQIHWDTIIGRLPQRHRKSTGGISVAKTTDIPDSSSSRSARRNSF